jgi:hypothetical protein
VPETDGPVGPWPSGPNGQPLTADDAGKPVWPSEQYRRDYERALAGQAARADVWRPRLRLLVIVLILVIGGSVALYRNHQSKQQTHDEVCQIVYQSGLTTKDCP